MSGKRDSGIFHSLKQQLFHGQTTQTTAKGMLEVGHGRG
jgi:hypothetical protein